MNTPKSEPLPKPDRPGRYRARWSNGEYETVSVIATGGVLFYAPTIQRDPDEIVFHRVDAVASASRGWWPL